MDNIRQEIQDWLELNARVVMNIPFDIEVQWEDIEQVAHSKDSGIRWEKYDRTYHWVFSDAVAIDHMSTEILEGDFTKAIEILKRYRGIILSEHIAKEII